MTDLTKLADELAAISGGRANLTTSEYNAVTEAARILRSAAAVDVDALSKRVRQARILACGAWSDVTEGGSVNSKKCSEAQKMEDELCASIAALESALRMALAARPSLSVWYGSMPESNGRTNWTATLRNGDLHNGFTFARSQYPHRVRYAADEVRHLIGELPKRPSILDYDADEQTPCHLCGGTGEVEGKPCWGLNFEGTVHQAAAAPKGTT